SDIKANSSQQEAVCDAQKNQSVLDSSIRVNIDLLDKLMNLVGELVLARNQFLQIVSSSEDANFIGISQRLNLITSELQEGIMKTRMQPINNIWRTFPRVVREISASLNKKVRMEMNGKETELDKTVIEAIKDPLTHIIRNSIDHGIEEPEIRKKKNKDVEGVLALRAFHEDGQVNIEISDDGAGIDINAVKQKALQRELISASQAAVMSDKDLLNLIFLPGFSTAKKVTNISGRGVGMDVVRKNIEKIGGTVDLENKPDGGTIVKIKIPLTLAIIPALIVTCGKDSYAIAQVNLLEIVRLKSFEARKKIEEIYGSPVYRLRGKLLPLVYLNKELKTESGCCHCDINSAEDYNVNIIVLQAANRQFGLIVDAINDTEEIVVKPLDKLLKNIPVFAGATIRGDGKVALIIDVLGLAKSSGVISTINDKLIYEKNFSIAKHNSETKRLLLFKNYDGGRMGILLSKVSRLEDLPASNIEKSGGLDVVQYRNQIMPLINLSNILPERRSDERKHEGSSYKDNIQLVVYSDEEKSYGIVVESIIDIIEAQLELQNATAREGTFGSCVILNKVTEILDMDSIIKKFETMIMNSSK
ncbi:MAG TPA: chemotaxis protein CheA, partial [Candidatus Wallbacteria bacterium]|nr:chemotaxis protein CheA [Candidatus Wallbacteria bacterium]